MESEGKILDEQKITIRLDCSGLIDLMDFSTRVFSLGMLVLNIDVSGGRFSTTLADMALSLVVGETVVSIL